MYFRLCININAWLVESDMNKKELKALDATALQSKLDEANKAIDFMTANGFEGATSALKQEVAWITEIQTGTAPKVDYEAVATAQSANLNAVLSSKPLGAKSVGAFEEDVKTGLTSENGLAVTMRLGEDGTLSFTVNAKKVKKTTQTGATSGADRAKSPGKSYLFNGKLFASSTEALGAVDEKGHFTGTAGDGTILGALASAGTVVALPTTSYSKPKEMVKLVNGFKLGTLEVVVKPELKEEIGKQCAEFGITTRTEGENLIADFIKLFSVMTGTKAPAEKTAAIPAEQAVKA